MSNFRTGGFQQLPIVVRNLLIINVLVFLIQQAFSMRNIGGINFEDVFALHYWQSPKFHWWQMFTHMFMHGSVMHIAFNMFALWMFGRILENFWGPQRFLIFYLICGVGAALCHLGVLTFEFTKLNNEILAYQLNPSMAAFTELVHKHSIPVNPLAWMSDPNPVQHSIDALHSYYDGITGEATLGASGAVFGLLFAFGYLFPNTELYIYFIPIPVKAKWVVGGYILIELTEGLANSAGDNIAHFAHLGGALFAFILLRIWKSRVRNNFY